MSQNTVTKEALISVINGLFQSIEAENEEKSQNLIDELCKLYEERGDDYYQIPQDFPIGVEEKVGCGKLINPRAIPIAPKSA